MNRSQILIAVLLMGLATGIGSAVAQVPVTPATNQEALLSSPDPKLAANKRLVYDLWRTLLEAGQLEKADQFLDPNYIQHNPNVATGRDAFVKAFSSFVKRTELKPTIQAPLVSIVAEGDLVVLAFVRPEKDPQDPTKTYTTTWFDMFRVKDGKVVEHWDVDLKR